MWRKSYLTAQHLQLTEDHGKKSSVKCESEFKLPGKPVRRVSADVAERGHVTCRIRGPKNNLKIPWTRAIQSGLTKSLTFELPDFRHELSPAALYDPRFLNGRISAHLNGHVQEEISFGRRSCTSVPGRLNFEQLLCVAMDCHG
jgi:hypothetical protein